MVHRLSKFRKYTRPTLNSRGCTMNPRIEEIQREVAAYHGFLVADLVGPSRRFRYAHPRQMAMYLCRKMTRRSYPEIAKQFGHRDHTTVIHAVRKVPKRALSKPTVAKALGEIGARLALRTSWIPHFKAELEACRSVGDFVSSLS